MNYRRYITYLKLHSTVDPSARFHFSLWRTIGALGVVGLIIPVALCFSTVSLLPLVLAVAIVAVATGVFVGDWHGALLAFEVWYFGTAAVLIIVAVRSFA